MQVPLLENGVRSAIAVARGIGAKCPWIDPQKEPAQSGPSSSGAWQSGGGAILKAALISAIAAASVVQVKRYMGVSAPRG